MQRFFKTFSTIFVMMLLSANTVFAANQYPEPAKENMLYIDVKSGTVKIIMLPVVAPLHVAQIKKYVTEGLYDGLTFHRVIPNFMAQTGDPTGTGFGDPSLPKSKAEFTSKYSFERGVVGMARTNNPDSASSQFFIMFDHVTGLDNKYTIWGYVAEGMEHIDAINKGEPPTNPDTMLKVYLDK